MKSPRTNPTSSMCSTLMGKSTFRYKPIPLDYVIIRGTKVDELGNLTTDEECMQLEVFSAVMACKKFGGKVIAQAKYKVKAGTLHPKRVIVPRPCLSMRWSCATTSRKTTA